MGDADGQNLLIEKLQVVLIGNLNPMTGFVQSILKWRTNKGMARPHRKTWLSCTCSVFLEISTQSSKERTAFIPKKRALKRKMEDTPSTSETFPVEYSEEGPLHTDFNHSIEDLQPEPKRDKPDKYIDHNYCSKYATPVLDVVKGSL